MISDLAKQLQADLKARGLYDGIVDGDWGPKSRAAWAAALALMPSAAAAPPALPAMTTGPDGIAVIKAFEDCHLRAYPDPASPLARALQAAGAWRAVLAGGDIPVRFLGMDGAPWTIGWGDTEDVVQGQRITQDEAEARLARRLMNDFEPAIRNAVKVQLTQRQFDSMVSIVYNAGPGRPGRDGIIRLSSGAPSTLLRKLNGGDFEGAADEFPKWNKAGGQVLLGLRRRRTAERALFLGTSGVEAVVIGKAVQG